MRQSLLVIIGLSLLAAPALAQTPPPPPPPPGTVPVQEVSRTSFQVGVGYLNEGDVYVEDVEVTIDGGPLATLAIDSLVAPRLSVGLFAVYASTEVAGTGVTIATVGGTLKARFGDQTGTHFRLGVAVGYQRITVDEDDGETIQGFDIAPVAEIAFATGGKFNFVLQASALSQPAGGNDDVEVTFAPIPYVAAILEFR